MTKVKTLHFDNTDSELDFVKVTFKNGSVVLLNTDQRGDAATVLSDLEQGQFDEIADLGWDANSLELTLWDLSHPNAVLIYGE